MKNNFESGERPLISDETAIEALKSNNMEVFGAFEETDLAERSLDILDKMINGNL